jgi:hypothetical protein
MVGVGASMGAHGDSPERKGKGKRVRGHRCGAPWGGRGVMGRGAGLASYGLPVAAVRSLPVFKAAVHEGEEEKKGRRKEKEGKEKRKKRKKYGKFSKLKNFRGEQ